MTCVALFDRPVSTLMLSCQAEEEVGLSKDLQKAFLYKIDDNENAAFCTHCKSTFAHSGNTNIKDDMKTDAHKRTIEIIVNHPDESASSAWINDAPYP